MKEIVTIAHNAVTAKIINASREVKLLVQQHLSYVVDGFEYMNSGPSSWNGRASFFEFTPATFPAGFIYMVYAHLLRAGYKVNIVKKPLPAPLGPSIEVCDTLDGLGGNPNYDYHLHVVQKLEKHGQIVARVATGGGKSRIARMAFARINRRTLFLTTRGILMYQMRDAMVDMGTSVAILGDGEWGIPYIDKDGTERRKLAMFNVGMVQTLAARLKDPDPRDTPEKQLYQLGRQKSTLEMLTHFEFVILEEAHEASGNSYYDIMKYCKNAYYRLSLTATPNMKDSEEANMRLMACSGPVAIKVSEKMLIDRGILAKPYFKFIALPDNPPAFYKDDKGHTHKLFRSTPWQKAYEIGIVHNELRNSLIVREAKIARKYGLNIMILVRHKKHGEILKRMISNEKMRCEFIFGENDQDERKTALNALQTGKIDILIGSTILDVGVDVPAVGMIIVAGAGKAEVGTRQRIGRGLRRKKVGPNVALIVDFSDPYNHHLIAHSAQRKAIIESTEGFAEGIISGEFDYAKLGFKV